MEISQLKPIILCLIILLIISGIVMIFGAFTIKSILKDEKSIKTGEDLLKKYPGIIFIMIPGFNIIFIIIIFLMQFLEKLMKKPFRE
jgi:hypothetical protein